MVIPSKTACWFCAEKFEDLATYYDRVSIHLGKMFGSGAEAEDVEDPSVFALERHLEDFLVANWVQTPLAVDYKLYEEDGEVVGQQLPTDTGPMDLLAVSNDGSELLVIELKKGRASDSVVGQVQRYMGYVKEALAEDHQTVRGMIIALEDDLKIKRALSVL